MSKALNEVYELQQTIKNAGFAWDARVTSMSLLSPEDRRLRCGAIFGPNEPTREERERVSQSHIEKKEFSDLAVRQMDWRNVNGACFVTPITQQGQCGSCVAFGVVATLEAHCRIAKNYPTTGSNAYRLPRLSEADLFFCGGGQLCTQGWQLCKAFDYAKSTGIVDAGCFPYSDHNQPCNRCATADRQKTKLSDYRWVTDVNEMRTLLIEHGPLTTCFFVYDDFYNYGGGVYKRTSNQFSAHHCVACIGFDDDRQAWICKNSWGPLWGDSGYFMIGYGQCGIDFVMGIPTGFSSIFELPEFYLGPPEKCGQGTNFAGSLNSSGAAVASYRNDKWPTLQYISGKLQASSVTWNQQIEYGLGYMPSMALNNSGSVVEVNKSSMNYDLHCRVGKLKANGTIEFNGSKKFAEGQLPRIALNDDNACVLCFRAADLPSSASAVVGVINHRKQIDWGISEVIATPDDAASIALEGDELTPNL